MYSSRSNPQNLCFAKSLLGMEDGATAYWRAGSVQEKRSFWMVRFHLNQPTKAERALREGIVMLQSIVHGALKHRLMLPVVVAIAFGHLWN